MNSTNLIDINYKPSGQIYPVICPEIKSGSVYFFDSPDGLRYEVSFGKKKNDYLSNIISFSVVSEDYEDEYSETNLGNVWRIIDTIIEVIKIYHENHPYSHSYEFSGEFKDDEPEVGASIRTRMFLRTLLRVVDYKFWNVKLEGNMVLVNRISV